MPKSSYIIDDGPISIFVGTQTDNFQFQKLFFKSGTLNPTNHTLVIKNLVQNGHLYIDFASVATPTVGATRSFPMIPPTSKLSSSLSTITGNSSTVYLLTYTSTDITSTGTTTPIATKLYVQPHKVSLYLWTTIGVICVACLGFGIFIVLRRRGARHKNNICKLIFLCSTNDFQSEPNFSVRITPFEVRPLDPFILMNEMRGCFTKARASFNRKHTINAISHPSGHSLSAAPPKYSGLD